MSKIIGATTKAEIGGTKKLFDLLWSDDGGQNWTLRSGLTPVVPVVDTRAAFLKRQGLAAPTAIGPDDSAAIGNALRFGK